MPKGSAPLIGYQTVVDWMGESVLTLDELWPTRPRAMIVGINPAPRSVQAGHYYQGRAGQLQLKRLIDASLFPAPSAGDYFEEVALTASVGFADLVRRPTRQGAQITQEELRLGRDRLVSVLAERAVPLIVCVFTPPVKALLGRSDRIGIQADLTSSGAQVFRMPSPYEAREASQVAMGELRALLAGPSTL